MRHLLLSLVGILTIQIGTLTPCPAGVLRWVNDLGRVMGVGVSNGYHARGGCAHRAFPPYALRKCTGQRCIIQSRGPVAQPTVAWSHVADGCLAPACTACQSGLNAFSLENIPTAPSGSLEGAVEAAPQTSEPVSDSVPKTSNWKTRLGF